MMEGNAIPRVTLMTTVHSPFDTRIFYKQAKTLVRAGYAVSLIAQHDGDSEIEGIRIRGLRRPRNRLERMIGLTWRAFRVAQREQADVYHFHDPELLPVGALLKLLTRAKLIYDVHEDVPRQLLTKHWISTPLRRPLAAMFNIIQKILARGTDAVVVATEGIAENFRRIDTFVVHNYPSLSMMPKLEPVPHNENENVLIYIGGISRLRGAMEMIRALQHVDVSLNCRLELIGRFASSKLEAEVQRTPGYKYIRYLGWQPWTEAWQRAQGAVGGLVLFHPAPNHVRALPNKLFEYMAAGLPVIASDFHLWKGIVEGNRCGLCVNPLDPNDIAQAIEYLIDHPDEARRMGENGRRAVEEKYSWESEARVLLDLYRQLVPGMPMHSLPAQAFTGHGLQREDQVDE